MTLNQYQLGSLESHWVFEVVRSAPPMWGGWPDCGTEGRPTGRFPGAAAN